MRNSSYGVSVAILSFFSYLPMAAQQPDSSNAGPCLDPKLTVYHASANGTGDTIEGGVCVEVSPVNRLRNFTFISTAVTQTAGPSPTTIFPESGQKTLTSGGQADIGDLETRVAAEEGLMRARLDDNRAAAAKLDDLLARLKEFVAHSDESVLGGDFLSVVNQIKSRKTDIDKALGGSGAWQAADDILKHTHQLQNNLALLPDATKTANQPKFNELKTRLDDLENKALLQASGGDQAKAIGGKLGLLQYWSDVLSTFLEPDGSIPKDPASKFVLHQDVPCGTLFNVNKETAVKLTVGDRLPFFDGQQMSTQTHDAFVTVRCASPFSLSAGVAFSFIEQREFAIQQSPVSPGSTTAVSKFGYSSRSTVHPLPLAMAHMRIHEWEQHRVGLHATFGVAANVQGTNAGGSDAEYLPGLSLSLFRTMYLTTGVHIGKQASLAGGFRVGDQVPSGITSPPIQTSYKGGLGFAITFTKP